MTYDEPFASLKASFELLVAAFTVEANPPPPTAQVADAQVGEAKAKPTQPGAS